MRLAIVDVETTGLEPEKGHRVVEIAAVELVLAAGDVWAIGATGSSFVNPGRPIPPEASGIHHIVDADVAGAPDLAQALEIVLAPFGDVDVCAFHNAKFDLGFLPNLKERRCLCTWRTSMHVWPDAPSFKNTSLFYWRGFRRIEPVEAHRAAYDALLTAHLLQALLAERSLEELLRLSTKAVVLNKVGFGKHFGMAWTEVPTSYLQWASGVSDMEPDVRFTVKTELARREGKVGLAQPAQLA